MAVDEIESDLMRASKSWKTLRRILFSVRSRKKRSIMFSHKAEVDVTRTWKHLCLFRQRCTRSCCWVA